MTVPLPPEGGWQQNQAPPPQPPPPGWQQAPWPQPPPNNTIKWLLIAVAILSVVAVSIGATLLSTRDNGRGGGSAGPSSSVPSEIASANDTEPAAIITDEPTCKAFHGISGSVADVQANGWGDQRNSLGPSSEWTTAQRDQVQSVATAMRNASDELVNLARQTPHRVVRELYEQYIAYGHAYSASIADYVPTDNYLADVNVSIGNALSGICNAIEYGSSNRSVALSRVDAPTKLAPVGDPSQTRRFVSSKEPTCRDFIQYEAKFIADTAEWSKLDPKIPGSQMDSRAASDTNVRACILRFVSRSDGIGRSTERKSDPRGFRRPVLFV